MPSIRIPEYFRSTIERLASMSDDEFNRVYAIIENLKPHVKPEALVSQTRSTDSKSAPDIVEIVQALSSLSIARQKAAASVDEFARDVVGSLPPRRKESLEAAASEARLKALLSIEALNVSARAFDVQHEYEHVWRHARIVTDIRSVFDPAGAAVVGAMIVHNLTISYIHNSESKEIIFALDGADLAELRKILDRAEIKTSTLEKLISKAEVPYFESK